MSAPMIGVDVDDFRLPTKEALRKAAELEFRAVEFAAVARDVAAWNLSMSGRRHLSRFVDGLGLNVAALVADMPGLLLTDPKTVDQRVTRTCQILELAAALKVPVVTASISALTDPETGAPVPLAVEALWSIGEFADSRGIVVALRPSYEGADRLGQVFGDLRCPAFAVGLDIAALVMTGISPVPVIDRFARQVVLVHMRDATTGTPQRAGHETRLGEGDVDLVGVLAALDDAGFCGVLVIRRTDSQSPIADILRGREVLSRLLASP